MQVPRAGYLIYTADSGVGVSTFFSLSFSSGPYIRGREGLEVMYACRWCYLVLARPLLPNFICGTVAREFKKTCRRPRIPSREKNTRRMQIVHPGPWSTPPPPLLPSPSGHSTSSSSPLFSSFICRVFVLLSFIFSLHLFYSSCRDIHHSCCFRASVFLCICYFMKIYLLVIVVSKFTCPGITSLF